MAGNQLNPNNDIMVPNCQNDSISCISWSPSGNIIVAGAWNKEVRCWEIQQSQIIPRASTTCDAPILSTAFSNDGVNVFIGGCDKTLRMWNLQQQQQTKIGQHEAPIKDVAFISEHKIVATASWDKTLKYWDPTRTSGAVMSVNLPERVYAMAVSFPLAVVATANLRVCVFDLNKPNQIFRDDPSPLKMQTRSLACFPDKSGFAIGSIEGRVGIQYVEEKRRTHNFAFKCHRLNDTDVYAVNSISFHPTYGTFATCGSDGGYAFWDKDAKQRLKLFNHSNTQITCSAFNNNGSLFAYALSYDWSKGYSYYKKDGPFQIMIHNVQDQEIAPRKK